MPAVILGLLPIESVNATKQEQTQLQVGIRDRFNSDGTQGLVEAPLFSRRPDEKVLFFTHASVPAERARHFHPLLRNPP